MGGVTFTINTHCLFLIMEDLIYSVNQEGQIMVKVWESLSSIYLSVGQDILA